jgi:hypothetical protein
MAPAACSFTREALDEPVQIAAQHENLGPGSEKIESDGTPNIPRCTGNQCDGAAEAHRSGPRLAYFIFIRGDQRLG